MSMSVVRSSVCEHYMSVMIDILDSVIIVDVKSVEQILNWMMAVVSTVVMPIIVVVVIVLVVVVVDLRAVVVVVDRTAVWIVVVAAAQLLVDEMTLPMSSFALRKNFSTSSRLTLALLIKMIVRVLMMPVLFDVQICSIYCKLLVALAHFSRAGIFAISAGDRIVPVLTSNRAVESVGVSLRVTVAFDVGFFDAGVAGA